MKDKMKTLREFIVEARDSDYDSAEDSSTKAHAATARAEKLENDRGEHLATKTEKLAERNAHAFAATMHSNAYKNHVDSQIHHLNFASDANIQGLPDRSKRHNDAADVSRLTAEEHLHKMNYHRRCYRG